MTEPGPEGRTQRSAAQLRPFASLALIGAFLAGAAFGQVTPSERLLSESGVRPALVGAIYRPPDRTNAPGVLVLHGSAGLRPAYHTYASDLSRAGYVVLVINLFADTGPAEAGSDVRLALWPRWEETVRSAVGYLRRLSGVDSGRMGVVGFSRGAWLAFTTLGNAPDVLAIVGYYGVGTQPLRWEAGGPAVLLLYGKDDQYANPAFVSDVAAGIRAAGRAVDLHTYDNVCHGFNFIENGTPSVRLATEDARARAFSFLARYLRMDGR